MVPWCLLYKHNTKSRQFCAAPILHFSQYPVPMKISANDLITNSNLIAHILKSLYCTTLHHNTLHCIAICIALQCIVCQVCIHKNNTQTSLQYIATMFLFFESQTHNDSYRDLITQQLGCVDRLHICTTPITDYNAYNHNACSLLSLSSPR